MDDGCLTDGQGNIVNFKNMIIIATSNAGFGSEALTGKKEDTDLMTKLASYFRPEFMNRFNGIVEFSHLTKADLMLNDVNRTLAKKDITLMVIDAVKSRTTWKNRVMMKQWVLGHCDGLLSNKFVTRSLIFTWITKV